MNTKIKHISTTLVAGKIATSSATLMAAGLGKAQSNNTLALDQIGYPMEILAPPINNQEIGTVGDNGSKYFTPSEVGTIFTSGTGKMTASNGERRIDFVISQIKKQATPLVVFLAYSTTKGNESQWQDLPLNNVLLDRDSMNIISAIQIEASSDNPFASVNKASTPLGTVNDNENSIIISLNLSDLNHPDFADNHIYFQVIAIPFVNGNFIFSDAQVSELDHYMISREVQGQANSGSKAANVSSGGKIQDTPTTTDNGNGGKSKGSESMPVSDTGGKSGSGKQ